MAEPVVDSCCSDTHLRRDFLPVDVVSLEGACQKFQSLACLRLSLDLHFNPCRLPFCRSFLDQVELDLVAVSLEQLVDHRNSDIVLLEPVVDSLSGDAYQFSNRRSCQSCLFHEVGQELEMY